MSLLGHSSVLRRLVRVLPDGPLLDPKKVFGEPNKNRKPRTPRDARGRSEWYRGFPSSRWG
jgi:hypothetical protein